MNRIVKKIDELNKKCEKVFVGFVPLMYPDKETMIKAVLEMEEGGVDIIEIGFSENPYMDGDIIKSAYEKVGNLKVQLENIFEVVAQIRKYSEIPILCMTYKSDLLNLKHDLKEKFLVAGIDGVIVPDIDEEVKERIDFDDEFISIDVVCIEDNFSDEEIKGFKYCISNKGKTGSANLNFDFIKFKARNFESYKNKIFIGFGMGDIDNINNLKEAFGGIIIGTEIVKSISKENLNRKYFLEKIKNYTKYIKLKSV